MNEIYKYLLQNINKFERYDDEYGKTIYFADMPTIKDILLNVEYIFFVNICDNIVNFQGYLDTKQFNISFRYSKNINIYANQYNIEELLPLLVDFNISIDNKIEIRYKNPNYKLSYEHIMNNISYFGYIQKKEDKMVIYLHDYRINEVIYNSNICGHKLSVNETLVMVRRDKISYNIICLEYVKK